MNSNEKKKCATQTTRNRSSNLEVKTEKKKSKLTLQESGAKKKTWSTAALIEFMKPSSEELKFREEKLKEDDILQKCSKLFRCTKCSFNFNSHIQNHKKVPVHPILGVIMCQKCCQYYEDGEFSLDSEGEDKYCRWCGEGGTILGCSKCICGFCATCIKRHFKTDFFKKVQKDDNWLCFLCNPQPLWPLRFIYSLAAEAPEGMIISAPKSNTSTTGCKDSSTEQSSSPETLTSKYSLQSKRKSFRKRVYISSSDESENDAQENLQKKLKLASSSRDSFKEKETESFENIKSNILKELEKVLKLSEYQLSFGVTWSNKMLKKLKSSDFLPTSKNLANECQKIKWFLSLLSTYLVQFCNSVNSIEKSLVRDDGTNTSVDDPYKNESPYTTILQFLGFINSQIKTFMEKGINLSDILEAEVYDDDTVIGIKKKIKSDSGSIKSGKNNNPVEYKTNFAPNDSKDTQSKEDREDQIVDSQGRDKDENSLDIIGDQNSEMNSAEYDKELSCPNVILGEAHDLKTSDPEEDIQEILAILENA